MRTGKLTQTAWQRSVRRQLRTKRDEVISVRSLCGRTPALPEMV